jgi:transposase
LARHCARGGELEKRAALTDRQQQYSSTPGFLWGSWWSKKNAIGRSKGGCTTKIHAVVDHAGRPRGIGLSPGNCHDAKCAIPLLDKVNGKSLAGDKAYSTNEIIDKLAERGIEAVIPEKSNGRQNRKINKRLYRKRYRVEVFFHNIKRFRAVASRYCKTACSFLSTVSVACMAIF